MKNMLFKENANASICRVHSCFPTSNVYIHNALLTIVGYTFKV
jgi:hypothetical protein